MRKKIVPLAGALAAGGFMMLLFKPAPAPSRSLGPSQRQALTDFQMNDLAGRPWRLSEHRGSVVLLNFWATWCEPCRMETPGLVRLAQAFTGQPFEIAGVAMDEGGGEVRQFVTHFHIPYTILRPPAGNSIASGIEAIPTTFLIDRQGRIAKTYGGAETEDVFREDVTRLLAEP
jgi:cytochrome c biogenesis protein CcmG, thiol:disulfide interchange protein DsbE